MAIFYYIREPETLQDCVGFICRLQFIMCSNGFYKHHGKFVINRWTRFYTVTLASLAVLGLCATLIVLLRNESILQRVLTLDKMVLGIAALELLISTLVFIISVLSLQFWAKRHLTIYARLAEIDRQLTSLFGAKLNYRKLLRKNILVLFHVIIIYVSTITIATATLLEGHHMELLLPAVLCYIIITSGPHLTGYMHMTLAELIGIRFRLLQLLLKNLFLSTNQQQLTEQRLNNLVEIIKELHYLIEEVNIVYNVGISSAMAHDYMLSTAQLYILFGNSLDPMSTEKSSNGNRRVQLVLLTCLSLCMLLPIYKMLISPIYCSQSVNEGRKCLQLLEGLDNSFPNSLVAKQLTESMTRWRLQYKVEFITGTGVVLNKTVVSVFISIVFNYLLVLIQFAMTQKLGEQVDRQKNALQDLIGV